MLNAKNKDQNRFCHFELECLTHGVNCKARFPNLQLRQKENRTSILYYRPPSAMRLGLLKERLIEVLPFHSFSVIPITGWGKAKAMRLIEDRGLVDQQRLPRRNRSASRSRSRSRSKSNSRLEDDQLRRENISVNLAVENRLKDIEIYVKDNGIKQENIEARLGIQKAEIELCKEEIATQDKQIDFCIDKITKNSTQIKFLREDLTKHRSAVAEKHRKWEQFVKAHKTDQSVGQTIIERESAQPTSIQAGGTFAIFQGVSGGQESFSDDAETDG